MCFKEYFRKQHLPACFDALSFYYALFSTGRVTAGQLFNIKARPWRQWTVSSSIIFRVPGGGCFKMVLQQDVVWQFAGGVVGSVCQLIQLTLHLVMTKQVVTQDHSDWRKIWAVTLYVTVYMGACMCIHKHQKVLMYFKNWNKLHLGCKCATCYSLKLSSYWKKGKGRPNWSVLL